MKDIKEFLNNNQNEEFEEINESVTGIITLTSLMIVIICQLMKLNDVGIKDITGGVEDIFDDIKYWWRDKKIRKVTKRLAEDSEVKAFFDQPISKQKGWRKLIETKLTDEEIKYLRLISKDKVSQNYK